MKLTWIGHSCFKLEKDGYIILFDPFADGSVPGIASVRETADLVLCSHEHGDHGAREVVTLREGGVSPFTVEIIDSFHDDANGTKRGPNKIAVISDGVRKIAHFGDQGCMPEPDQIEKLKGMDLVLMPVGGHFTIDGAQAAELVQILEPKHVVPMHYRDDAAGFGFGVIGPVNGFTDAMESVAFVEASELDLTEELPAQVIVMKPHNKEN